ncbi:MAG: sugar phosphate isomerase/epimerase [Victivallaceae bacterium]|nr:sugar phosphate isomerase/epimerase [Victivallaceae bacterium]
MKVLMHVNYYEGAGKLDKLFKLAEDNFYDGVELRWKYRFDDMTQIQYQEKVAQLKQQYPDFEIVFGGTVEFCRGNEAEVASETKAYLGFLEWAKEKCDTKVMNFFTGGLVAEGYEYTEFDKNGSDMATEDDYQKSADGLKLVGDKAAELDMLIALETHNCYLHDLAAPSKKLMELTNHDAIGMNYDHGNILINKNGESIDQVFELLDGKIYYAHLKNIMVYKNVYLVTRLEEGHIDTMHVVDKLQDNLKSAMVTLEYSAPGDGIIAAKRDMEYMRFIKKELDIC